MLSEGYTTKFTLDLIEVHTDFTSASWTMDVLSAGTDDIVSLSGITISSSTVKSYSSLAPSTSPVTYILSLSDSSDVYYQTNDQSILLVENNVYDETPDLPCSSIGLTSIIYSLSSYNGQVVPSWVLIDSITGHLTISAVDVSIDSTFSFYINSEISSPANIVKKKITLSVRNWAVQNCIKCIANSNSICSTCSTGYVQTSGLWQTSSISSSPSSQNSQTNTSDKNSSSISQYIRIGCQIVAGITIILVTIWSLFNISTMASLWAVINQIQLYFLLLITRAFIPEDVQTVITGLSFTLNPFQYLPFSLISFYSSFIDKFNFKLSNLLFDPVGVNSDSIVWNTLSFFTNLVLMMILHFLLLVLQKLSQKCNSNENSHKWAKITKYVINRSFTIMTFGYYIRAVLEMSQYFLISSIFEIHEFNVSQTLRRISLIFAFVVLALCLCLILISILFVLLTNVSSQQMQTKWGEFFTGLKIQKKYRFYAAWLLARRTIYVALLITFTFASFKVLLIFLSIFQMCYAIFICILRPYEEVKDNMIEIMNEIFFIFLLSFLIFVNTEDEWTYTKSLIYIGILALNNLIAFFIISSKCKLPKYSCFNKTNRNQMTRKKIKTYSNFSFHIN